MSMAKKKYTEKEKLSILKEGDLQGVKKTLAKYDLYPATYYFWKKKYQSLGAEGLAHGANAERLKELKRLRRENEMLKQIIAEKELEGKLKDELIKKKYR
ncbi:MAG: transposase [Saprospiraceae bacterium]|nr:transposase [Saprospiraceae bacterium]